MNNYLEVLFYALLGSYTAYANGEKRGFKSLLNRLLEGVFVAFVFFKLALYATDEPNIAIGIGGASAWFGVQALEFIRENFREIIQRRKV